MIIHALIGGLIGSYSHSVILIIILCILSHILMDIFPHWDGPFDRALFYSKGEVKVEKIQIILHFFDLIFSLLIIIILYLEFDNSLIILGGFVSIFPDIIKIGYFTRLRKSNWYMRHLKFHSKIQNEVNWKLGLITQAVILISMIILFINHKPY